LAVNYSFDLYLADHAKAFLETLSQNERKVFFSALEEFLRDPIPDDITKFWVDAPPALARHRQVAAAEVGGFWIFYRFASVTTIHITHVQRAEDP